MLNLKGISKSYARRGVVLGNIDLVVNEAETVAITGPSGSGKTTLLNLIGLLDQPDSGEISFRGSSILDFDSDRAAGYRNMNIGFVFQEHLLLPHLTIEENILLPLLAVKKERNEMKEKISWCHELMEMVGIKGLKDDFPFRISGGEAQRASLVRALINNPSMVLADEPTGSLDSENAGILADLLLKLNKSCGTAVIAVTHSALLAGKMSHRYRLENGSLTPY